MFRDKGKELNNLINFGTFTEVIDIGQEIISNKWIWMEKELHDGHKWKVKGRLVTKGFQVKNSPKSNIQQF